MTYFSLADGRDEAGMIELDTLLADEAEQEAIRERQNMKAMQALQGQMAGMRARPR